MTESFFRKAFIVTAVILSLISLSTAASWCSMSSELVFDTDEYFYSDMGFTLLSFFLYALIVLGIMFTVITAITAGVWGILGFSFINNNSTIKKPELENIFKIYKFLSAAALAAAPIIMIIHAAILKSGIPFLALLLCWQNPFFMWLFYLRRLKMRCFPGSKI